MRSAVLGCGVSSLSTAILLRRPFQNGPGTVTIYAKALPPNTTSNIAGILDAHIQIMKGLKS